MCHLDFFFPFIVLRVISIYLTGIEKSLPLTVQKTWMSVCFSVLSVLMMLLGLIGLLVFIFYKMEKIQHIGLILLVTSIPFWMISLSRTFK